MKVLITRPRDEAASLAHELAEAGVESAIEPLLEIESAEAGALDLEGVAAILVTSGNGASGLAAATPRRDIPVLAVGDATAARLGDAGFADVASAEGDAAALAAFAAARLDPADGALLHAAGDVVAGGLADALAASGFTLRREIVYRTRPATALSPETEAMLAAGELDAVLFFSPRTAELFVSLVRQAGAEAACGRLIAVCLSSAVAAKAGGIVWKRIEIAERPDRAALLAGLDGLNADHDSESEVSSNLPPENPDDEETAAPTPAAEGPPQAGPEAGPPPLAGPLGGETAPRRGLGAGGVVGLSLLMTIVVLGVVAGAGYATWPQWRDLVAGAAPRGDEGATAARLDRLAGDVAASRRDVETLKDAVASDLAGLRQGLAEARGAAGGGAEAQKATASVAALTGQVGELADKVAALEARPVPDPAEAAALRAANERLASRVADLETRLAEAGRQREAMRQTAAEATARAQQAAQDLEKRMAAQIEETLAAYRARLGDARAAALVLAVGQLRDALHGPAPYAAALDSVATLAGKDEKFAEPIAALRKSARQGLKTHEQLAVEFGRFSRAISQAAVAPDSGGWLDRTLARLSRVVTWRRTGDNAPAGSTDAVLNAADAALTRGDLAAAVAALDTLNDAVMDAAAGWLLQAHARVDAEAAADELARRAIAQLGAEAAAQPTWRGSGQ